MTQGVWNDVVLVMSLLYLSIDIQQESEAFSNCQRPLHKWLLVSYLLVICSRLIYIAGTVISMHDTGGDFLLNLRQKSTTLRMLTSFTWLVIMPFFTVWSMVGTAWLWQARTSTPQCLPSGMHLWFFMIWQVLSYAWIMVHCSLGAVAWFLERRLRKHESDLRQIEDADVVSRWGTVSQLQGYTSLPGMQLSQGLTPAEINSLPSTIMAECSECSENTEEECSICLHAIRTGDSMRQLAGCRHCFHKSCIDLWLLRSTSCPLCKRNVGTVPMDSCGDDAC